MPGKRKKKRYCGSLECEKCGKKMTVEHFLSSEHPFRDILCVRCYEESMKKVGAKRRPTRAVKGGCWPNRASCSDEAGRL